jgi:hypothetical protein
MSALYHNSVADEAALITTLIREKENSNENQRNIMSSKQDFNLCFFFLLL